MPATDRLTHAMANAGDWPPEPSHGQLIIGQKTVLYELISQILSPFVKQVASVLPDVSLEKITDNSHISRNHQNRVSKDGLLITGTFVSYVDM
jgi:hypothetical protein